MTLFHLRSTLALAAALLALPASAQSLDDAASLSAATVQPSGVAAPAPARASRTLVTKEVLRDLSSPADRDWTTHTMGREYKEDFNCPISFAFGGELRANGYKGLKLFGTTVPVNKPADSGR